MGTCSFLDTLFRFWVSWFKLAVWYYVSAFEPASSFVSLQIKNLYSKQNLSTIHIDFSVVYRTYIKITGDLDQILFDVM